MSTSKILLALAVVGIRAVSAQCSASTITIAAPAEATINCRTVEGSIVFDENDSLSGDINISGPQSIKGDLIINGTKNIVSLSSSTIGNIGGKFQLTGLERVSALDFTALQTVGSIEWVTLPALERIDFGTEGVTTVESVKISDTHLSSLSGLNMVSVGTFDISNNGRLTEWTTQMTNITKLVTVAQNSDQLLVSFPKLTWAKQMEFRGIKGLSVPALKKVNDSLRFDDNNLMESFIAPNLTEAGLISFINNDALNNLSIPLLKKSGDITIRNNQELEEIDAFPELTSVNGAVTFKGNFTDASLPKLEDVKGAFIISSTEDIKSVCDEFQKLKSSGDIQGRFTCLSENANANEGSEGSSDDDEDGAALVSVSSSLAVVAAIAAAMQLL